MLSTAMLVGKPFQELSNMLCSMHNSSTVFASAGRVRCEKLRPGEGQARHCVCLCGPGKILHGITPGNADRAAR
jgi:hypothetical protein